MSVTVTQLKYNICVGLLERSERSSIDIQGNKDHMTFCSAKFS